MAKKLSPEEEVARREALAELNSNRAQRDQQRRAEREAEAEAARAGVPDEIAEELGKLRLLAEVLRDRCTLLDADLRDESVAMDEPEVSQAVGAHNELETILANHEGRSAQLFSLDGSKECSCSDVLPGQTCVDCGKSWEGSKGEEGNAGPAGPDGILVPDLTIEKIKLWVDEAGAEVREARLKAALAAEAVKEEPGKRTTLIEWLEGELAEAAAPTDPAEAGGD